jgi:nucleoside-diphosphate-sugar epimerase
VRDLITGGAGFIGSHVAEALAARGDEVLVLDDLSTGRLENLETVLDAGSVEFIEGSVTDAALVDDCVRATDRCFHLAAAVGVQLVVANPLDSLMRNVRGTEIVLEATARHRRRTLFASSSEVYGKASREPLREDSDRLVGSPLKSRWGYAAAKTIGEALAHAYFREQGSEMVTVRLFNTVGPRQRGAYGMVLPRFVGQALSGADLTVFGNGTQSRCFVHVADVVEALLMLIESDLASGQVFNVGSSEETAIVELARRVIDRTASPSGIRLVPYDEAYAQGFEEIGQRMPDTTALRRLTGWQRRHSTDDAIDAVIEFQRAEMQRRGARVAG